MNELLIEYDKSIENYKDFQVRIYELLKDVLTTNNLKYHKIECRVKNKNSLEKKISIKNNKYNSINQITDIIGVRIITFYEDDVDAIAKLLEEEFVLDKLNSIDKRIISQNQFGYKSLHYILTLSQYRTKLTEYKKFAKIKFEVQIRSILQHAWAEIEHDIGYKGELEIPTELKRDFSRVSALLETADNEFLRIKEKIRQYEQNVSNAIKNDPSKVELNSNSLKTYIQENKLIKQLDNQICKQSRLKLNNGILANLSTLERLYFLEIKTVENLDLLIKKHSKKIPLFAKLWLEKAEDRTISFSKGISVFYLMYVILGEKNDIEYANIFSNNILIKRKPNEKRTNYIGEEIISTYKKINIS